MLLAAPSGTALGLSLSADFDHASLDVASSIVAGQGIDLVGRDNFNQGEWKWLYFRTQGVMNLGPVYRIGDNFAGGGSNLLGHAMVYSYDRQTWAFFDNNVRSASAETFTFWNDNPFTAETVYVAYGIPYPVSRTVSHTTSLIPSPWVRPTPSGVAGFVVGTSPGGIDDLGRVIPAADLLGYRIRDDAGPSQRSKVVLTGGVHANETLGNLVLEGMVDFLVGDSLEAGLLRRSADFFVYPLVNPDGRFAGYNRSTVANPDEDPNRFWSPPNYGGLQELREIGGAILTDTGGAADYLIDFHSTVSGKDGHFGFVFPSMQSDPVWQNLLRREPAVLTRNAQLEDDTTAKFGATRLDADFSITFETQFLPGESEERFLALGASFGQAFADSLIVFADLNLDRSLDTADWSLFVAGSEGDLSGLTPIEAYLRGDLDGDGANSILDFGLFKSAFEQHNGSGAFAQMLSGVPEPSAVLICVMILSAAVLYPRRIESSKPADPLRRPC